MQHVQVLERERMPQKRSALAFWDALYELWRLSWYETHPNQTVPRCVPVKEWLGAINQCRLERNDDDDDHDDKDTTLTMEELIHVAGGLVKSRMVSLRFQGFKETRLEACSSRIPFGNTPVSCEDQGFTFVYSILTNAAVKIQHFLCLHVVDQRLRPGLPGSADQVAALAMHEAQPVSSKLYYVNLHPHMAELHESRGRRHLNAMLKNLSGRKRKRKAPAETKKTKV